MIQHLVTIRISPELATEILTTGYSARAGVVCVEGLPKGAVFVNARVGYYRDIELTFSHPSFPEVAEGADPPYRGMIYRHKSEDE